MEFFKLQIQGNLRQIKILGLFKINWHKSTNLKKIAIFGNCVTAPVAKILQNNSDIKNTYEVLVLKPCFMCSKDDVPKIYRQIKKCDVLIMQHISGEHYKKLKLDTKTLQSKLKKKARLIIAPTPYFTGYNPEQMYLHKSDGTTVGECIGLPHPYHNKLILYGFINNMTPEEIFEVLNADYNLKNMQENVTRDIEELIRREEYCDFKISEFIEKNYKKTRLFWTLNHPTNALLEFITEEILKLLSLNAKNHIEDEYLDNVKTPILKSVKKDLNLSFDDDNVITLDDIKQYYKYYENNPELVKANSPVVQDII